MHPLAGFQQEGLQCMKQEAKCVLDFGQRGPLRRPSHARAIHSHYYCWNN